ncbi:uncharacterized protein LOC123718947 [Pieris brassicae]|uniref:uncharacterized protein LOC123718947 n=1 Tax=Pieris brassicae TaxID=7116 RepID=UPI001E65E6F3|nr:uncharacterized protein LOC123718947 [Pieris brassicae]
MGGKRKRFISWAKEEKQLLKNILQPYLPIIENKDLSSKHKDKINAWNDITKKFNQANLRSRNKTQLANHWKLNKFDMKKEKSSYRREESKTEGGPKPPSPPDTMNVAECVILSQDEECSFVGFFSDSDEDITNNIVSEANDIPKDNEANQDITNNIVSEANDIPKDNEANQNNPITPVKSPLRTPKKKTPTTRKTLDITNNIVSEANDIPKDNEANQDNPITPVKSPLRTPKKKTPTTRKTLLQKASSNFSGEASCADMYRFWATQNERSQKEHELKLKNMAEKHSQLMINLKLQSLMFMKTLEKLKNK